MSDKRAVELETVPAPAPAESPESYVRRVTKSSGTSFYYAFLTLPRPRREAIFAVYAFCRAVDAAVDEAPDPETAASEIARWRRELDLGLAGRSEDPIAIRVGEVSEQFELPRRLFEEVIEGVACDLEPLRFATFVEMGRYCDLVAGAVGRLCVRIFGHREAWADEYADALGRALQITNILRDIGPDAELGRFYLPLEDLARFGLEEADVLGTDPRRVELLRFEARRAEEYFAEAARLSRNGGRELCAAEVMGAIYRRLLTKVIDAGFPAGPEPVRVPRSEKLAVALRTWLRIRLSRPSRL